MNELKLFCVLKLISVGGKIKLDNGTMWFVSYLLMVKSIKTTKRNLERLVEKGYVRYNAKTKYYILNSFDKIRDKEDWENRLAIPLNFSGILNIKAVAGAVIYGYLHKDFWRKVKSKKSVQIKGSTYHFPTPKFNYKDKLAPVSVLGVSAIFNFSPATASRLKNSALKAGLLQVQKNYSKLKVNKNAMVLYCKYREERQNIVFKDGNHYLQLIDTICPLFYFTKRKSLKT
ncbi:hypothetical protein [Mangrovimonas futianensis]|uniref:hypothetical protein n=1 Tax=Mangrovimonas futianensis TaxID=2895523 RepID=UPI001E3901D1|nr:hypothetical protein [Mangrovimonas futianensis]MCF1420317.1 hypothetical protein [Mangrovimonas futianensis]